MTERTPNGFAVLNPDSKHLDTITVAGHGVGAVQCGGEAMHQRERFAAARENTRAFERAAALAQRLHLEAEQFQTRLDFLKDGIVETDAIVFNECHGCSIASFRIKLKSKVSSFPH